MSQPLLYLDDPASYGWVQGLLVPRRCRKILVERYLKPQAGSRLLDIGCGTGIILDYLPELEYWGLDESLRYLTYAGKRYGVRAHFIRADLRRTPWPVEGRFDRVLAIGVLHHLTDKDVVTVLGEARRLLKPGGRLVTLDGCYETSQSLIARTMLRLDRGKHIRAAENYLALAGPIFKKLDHAIERKLLRIPYSHLVMEMTRD